MDIIKSFINGAIIGQTDSLHDVYNPALGRPCAQVAFANEAECDQAVMAAQAVFPQWSQTTPLKRARILFNFKQLLMSHQDELAACVTREHGKVLADAFGSVQRGIELVEYLCGIPHLLTGQFSTQVSEGMDCFTYRQPLGVCVGITPFNFPVMVPIWMFATAIACGNTFVLKPSEKDPTAAIRLAQLMQQAGLPEGVFNVVQGGATQVNYLIQHPQVAAVSCVGSSTVSQHVYQTAVGAGKRAQTFGGAKNHAVVLPDAHLEETAHAIAGAAFGSAGERCMALSVVVAVGEKVADQLVKAIGAIAKSYQVGPGDQANVDIGPLVTAEHYQRVQDYVTLGVAEGAELVLDGRSLTVKGHEQGFFMGPCLFDYVRSEMRIYQEEIFGPVLCLVRVAQYEEALALVNQHRYGNGTAIFTQDGAMAQHYTRHVQVGMVGVNVPIPVPVAYHVFGGWKDSVYGDTALHGAEGVRFYTQPKSITQRWPQQVARQQLHMPTH